LIASRDQITGEAVAAHYDELDYFYRDVWGEHVHHGLWRRGDETRAEAVRALVELVAREARIGEGTRVCDIGCGYGATARMLAAEFGAKVTAVTISPAQHAFASASSSFSDRRDEDEDEEKDEEGNAANPTYLLGDWLRNSLPDASFDAAIAIESSEHMPDKAAFFAQAFRVLRPGGRLVVCAWLSADAPTPRQQRWLLEPICREGRMPHMGTVAEYENLAGAAGFTCERMEDVTRQVAGTWPAIVRTFAARLVRRPRYICFLFDRHARNRVFALTILRIWLAYRTGAMRYAIFSFGK
jgi:tocopherol O-methyltransferase